jgi:hypothetical protein
MSAADKATYLRDMVNATPPVFEDGWLDFKGGTHGPAGNSIPLPDTTVKELWSKALCGFANTGGGVLVWGIDARPRPSAIDPTKKVDAATGVRLIPDPQAFKSRLMTLHHMATDPPVSGIQVEAINDAADGGFVVCLIPESNFKPHRAEWTGEQYYMRIGDDFVVIPRSILASMFYPRTRPQYRATVACQNFYSSNLNTRMSAWIDIENTGTATARDTYIVIEARPEFLSLTSYSQPETWLPEPASHKNKAGLRFRSGSVHPGTTAPTIRLNLEAGPPDFVSSCSLQFSIYSQDVQPQTFIAKFGPTDLHSLQRIEKQAAQQAEP